MPTCLPPVVKGVNNLPAVGVVSSFYPLAGLFLQVKRRSTCICGHGSGKFPPTRTPKCCILGQGQTSNLAVSIRLVSCDFWRLTRALQVSVNTTILWAGVCCLRGATDSGAVPTDRHVSGWVLQTRICGQNVYFSWCCHGAFTKTFYW